MNDLLDRIRACTHCATHLPHKPRPVIQAAPSARLLIIGQAPGARVHASGVPWNDASGRLLRNWLDLDESVFYDPAQVALMPMGFCYPGKGPSGDLPPRRECSLKWHDEVRGHLQRVRLTLLVGMYSQRYYLAVAAGRTLTETVRAFRDHLPEFLPIPHPSPRNRLWLRRNPWFEIDLLPVLRRSVAAALK